MKTIKRIIYCTIVLFLSISCKKDDLPEASQEGKNIMAAKVNGKAWVKTACFSCIEGGSGLRANYSNNILNIVAQQENSGSISTIEILLFVDKPAEYLSTTGYNYLEYGGSGKYYKTSINSTGTINVTKLDPIKKVISGTLSFRAQSQNDANDVVYVTDGRFDVTYK